MSFRPNMTAQIMRKQAKRDIHGREQFDPMVPVPIALVRLSEMVEESSVRADQTASRGSADQEVLQAKFLVSPHLAVSKGDVFIISGRNVEVAAIHPRVDIFGKPHHQEVGGNIKGDL